jgi:hypothetical protein
MNYIDVMTHKGDKSHIEYDIIGDVLINLKTNYWIYTMSNERWTEYMVHLNDKTVDESIITSYDQYAIKHMDIILIYSKLTHSMKSGFVAIIQVYKSMFQNKNKIKVFKDNNLNRFYSSIETVSIFDTPITLVLLEDKLKNMEGYKSTTSFKHKYTQIISNMQQVPCEIGKKIIEELFNIRDAGIPNTIKKTKAKTKKKEIEMEVEEVDKPVKMIKKKIIKALVKKPITKAKKAITYDSISEHTSYSDADTNDEANKEEEEEENEHKNGYCPIMITPCTDFIIPCDLAYDENDDDIDAYGNSPDVYIKINYILNHIRECNKCDITNNGTCELSAMNSKCIYSFCQYNESHIECQSAIKKYHELKKYNPFGDIIDKLSIKIIYIYEENSGDMYNGNIMILVAKPENYNTDINYCIQNKKTKMIKKQEDDLEGDDLEGDDLEGDDLEDDQDNKYNKNKYDSDSDSESEIHYEDHQYISNMDDNYYFSDYTKKKCYN